MSSTSGIKVHKSPQNGLGDFWCLLYAQNVKNEKGEKIQPSVYFIDYFYVVIHTASFDVLVFKRVSIKNISLKYAIYLPKIYRKIYTFLRK